MNQVKHVIVDGELRHDGFPVILQQVDGDLYANNEHKEDGQSSYFVAMSENQEDYEDCEDSLEPEAKRLCVDNENEEDVDNEEETMPSLQQILCEMNKELCVRLDSIEKKLEALDQRTKYLENRLDLAVAQRTQKSSDLSSRAANFYPSVRTSSGAIVIGLPLEKSNEDDMGVSDDGKQRLNHNMKAIGSPSSIECPDLRSLGPNVTLITLNNEADYPNGSWLGNENIPDQRVRVPISQSDLLHIESNCRTAEKMALALLDYLFDRDTQAGSNLSGMGKHGKKKLDPLFIYGLRCHLVRWFGITEKDWHRIKLNIDSKCRTAFRRKMRGQSLSVKAFRGRSQSTLINIVHTGKVDSEDDGSLPSSDTVLQLNEDSDTQQALHMLANNQLHFIAATAEQVARLKPRLQLVSDGQYVLQTDLNCGLVQNVTLSSEDGVSLVTSDTGELLQIIQPSDVVTIDDSLQQNESLASASATVQVTGIV